MAITNSEMQEYARRQMRDRVGGKANAIINEAINSALIRIAKTIDSPYYSETASLNLYGNYETGTIAIANGETTVTLTGGTFPSTMDSTWELRTGGQYYKIASRDSATQLTLASAWHPDPISGETYQVYKDRYTLTSNMLQMGERLFFGRDWPYGPDPVGFESLLQYKEGGTAGASRANMWAVRKDEIVVWPHPTESLVVNYMYIRKPAKVTFDESANLDIDDQHEDLLEAAIDLELAKRQVCVLNLDAAYSAWKECAALAEGNERAPRSLPASRLIRGSRYYLNRTIDTSS